MGGNFNRTVHKLHQFLQICHLCLSTTFYKKIAIPQSLDAFEVPAVAWKPFCIARGDSLLRGYSSLAEVITKYLCQLSLLIYSTLSKSDSDSEIYFVSCVCQQKKPYLERKEFTTLSPHPSPSQTRGCISKLISSRHYTRTLSAV